MNDKEKRSKMRIPLIHLTGIVKTESNYRSINILNISESGAFIKNEILKPKQYGILILELPSNLGKLELEFVNKRTQWVKNKKFNNITGSGIEFLPILDYNKQKVLHSYLIYLRNKQIITVSKRIIEDFFQKKP